MRDEYWFVSDCFSINHWKYIVFLPVVLAFFPSLSFLVVRRNYALIVGETKTSAACSPLLLVNDKKGLDMFHTTSLASSSSSSLLRLHFHPQTKAFISCEILYFVPRNTLFLSAATRDGEAHVEERKNNG